MINAKSEIFYAYLILTLLVQTRGLWSLITANISKLMETFVLSLALDKKAVKTNIQSYR